MMGKKTFTLNSSGILWFSFITLVKWGQGWLLASLLQRPTRSQNLITWGLLFGETDLCPPVSVTSSIHTGYVHLFNMSFTEYWLGLGHGAGLQYTWNNNWCLPPWRIQSGEHRNKYKVTNCKVIKETRCHKRKNQVRECGVCVYSSFWDSDIKPETWKVNRS